MAKTVHNQLSRRVKLALLVSLIIIGALSYKALLSENSYNKPRVTQILRGDLNNDSAPDLAISLWRTGNYGPAKPLWAPEQDNSYRMHLFLYTHKRGALRPMWFSSNLPKENLRLYLLDINKDGKNELLTFEKDYSDFSPRRFSIALWHWDIWGFILINRIHLPPNL